MPAASARRRRPLRTRIAYRLAATERVDEGRPAREHPPLAPPVRPRPGRVGQVVARRHLRPAPVASHRKFPDGVQVGYPFQRFPVRKQHRS